MNFTLISYKEADCHTDRYGDHDGNEGEYNVFFSKDRKEFIEYWASEDFKGTADLTILLNGVPEYEWDNEEQLIYDQLDTERHVVGDVLYEEAKVRKAKIAEAMQIQQVQRANAEARAQRDRDLLQLAALQKKLGV